MYANLCRRFWLRLESLKPDERGVTAIEYAILGAVVAVGLAFALDNNWFDEIFTQLQTTITAKMPTT